MDMKKELEDFGTRLAGAFLGMEESAATEIYWLTHGKPGTFPYNQLVPGLAPNDNLVVAGLSFPPWVIGKLFEDDAEKKGDTKSKGIGEAVRKFGEGDVCYSFSLMLHNTLVRNIPNMLPIPQARAVGQGGTGLIERPRVSMRGPLGQGPTDLTEKPRVSMTQAPGSDVNVAENLKMVNVPPGIHLST